MKNLQLRMNTKQRIKHEQEYIQFLERRLASKNFQKNSTPDEIEKTQNKLKKARLVFRTLK
jgi:hypothetical protein